MTASLAEHKSIQNSIGWLSFQTSTIDFNDSNEMPVSLSFIQGYMGKWLTSLGVVLLFCGVTETGKQLGGHFPSRP